MARGSLPPALLASRRTTPPSQSLFFMSENVLIWNVRGLNMRARRAVVREFLLQERVSALAEGSVSVDDFIASLEKPLEPSLLNTPSLRVTREPTDWLPKRSAQLAAKANVRGEKPEKRARKVLMRKLGYEVETERPDEASFQEFHDAAFQLAVTGDLEEAMDKFFHGRRQRASRAARA